MGWVKNVLMPESEAPWAMCRDQFVCGPCLNDCALAAIVKQNVEGKHCDYCEKRGRKAFTARLSHVVKHMYKCVSRDWVDPVHVLPHDSSEGGYQGKVVEGDQLLGDLDFEADGGGELFEDVARAFCEHPWCQRFYFSLTPIQQQRYGWERFKRAVKHERRYTFWSMGDGDVLVRKHPPVGRMLEEISKQIRCANLVRMVRRGKSIWRVRVHESTSKLTRDSDLSPPPVELALKSNRMNPSGIAMFYGAEDFDTACVETVDVAVDAGRSVTGGRFVTRRSLRILDLFELPEIPSYFDLDRADLYHALIVLRDFALDLAAPVANDGRAHIEYVPTQAFTEYVRFQMKAGEDSPIDGIRYRSSRNDRACYVLFCGQRECVDHSDPAPEQRWLALDPGSLRTMPVVAAERETPKRRSPRRKVART